MSAPIFPYRIGLDLSRKSHGRESINKMDKTFKSDPRMKAYYTGLVGRRMCFQFETEQNMLEFKRGLAWMLKEGTYSVSITVPTPEPKPEPVLEEPVKHKPFTRLPLTTKPGMLVKVHIGDYDQYSELTYGIVADSSGEKPKLLYQSLAGLPTLQFDRILELDDVEFPEGFLTHRKNREARMLSATEVNQVPLKRKLSRYENAVRIGKDAALYKETFEKRIA